MGVSTSVEVRAGVKSAVNFEKGLGKRETEKYYRNVERAKTSLIYSVIETVTAVFLKCFAMQYSGVVAPIPKI